jgi:hypothetical protein
MCLPVGRAAQPSRHAFASRVSSLLKSGGEGGILSEHPKKFSVVMVKRKPNGINGQFDEKLFCQCHWEI